MKCFITIISLTLICIIGQAQQTSMPERMAKSELQIRPGINELGGMTVGDFFLNKKFKTNELLDGTITTSKYGNCKLEGNVYTLEIDIIKGNNKISTISFILEYLDEITLLQTVKVENILTGEKSEDSEFSSKFQILQIFISLIEQKK